MRTLTVVDRNRPDILRTAPGGPTARYDRSFTLEVWYPAALAAGQRQAASTATITRDPAVIVTLRRPRRARRRTAGVGGPFPLVILSHGYPGNRYLMSHLGENLASKGYVVVSIDHPDSTYDDQKAFASTLYNRPFDQLFVLNEMARLGAAGSGSVLAGLRRRLAHRHPRLLDGRLRRGQRVGGGYRDGRGRASGSAAEWPAAGADGRRTRPIAPSIDPRVKAAIAIGPWGMQTGFWDAAGLAGIRTPMLFVAGSVDEVSGYEKGTRAIFEGAVNADRYLLTFLNASHNAGAPIPAPRETYAYSESLKLVPVRPLRRRRVGHGADEQHPAALRDRVRGPAPQGRRRPGAPISTSCRDGRDGVFALDAARRRRGPTHTYWKGFKRGTAVGLTLSTAGGHSAELRLVRRVKSRLQAELTAALRLNRPTPGSSRPAPSGRRSAGRGRETRSSPRRSARRSPWPAGRGAPAPPRRSRDEPNSSPVSLNVSEMPSEQNANTSPALAGTTTSS